jgi:hypothetical protein
MFGADDIAALYEAAGGCPGRYLPAGGGVPVDLPCVLVSEVEAPATPAGVPGVRRVAQWPAGALVPPWARGDRLEITAGPFAGVADIQAVRPSVDRLETVATLGVWL